MIFLKKLTAYVLSAVMLLAMCVPAYASYDGTTTDESIDGWVFTSTNMDSEISIDNSAIARGNGSVKLVARSLNTAKSSRETKFVASTGVQLGKRYQLEFESKALNASQIYVQIARGSWVNLVPNTPTYDWSTFKLGYTHHTNEGINISFIVTDKTEAWWLDNIRFYDVENPDVNLIRNGDFENIVSGGADASLDKGKEFEYFSIYPGTKTIDGNIDDWADAAEFHMANRREYIKNSGAGDISSVMKLSYDKDNLYVMFKVYDKTHKDGGAGSTYWTGDSAQFRYMGDKDRPSGTEYAVAWIADEQRAYTPTSTFKGSAKREGDYTYYEAAVPWSNAFNNGVPQVFPFNAIVNNNDGGGRVYNIEFTGGIAEMKNPDLYKKAHIYSGLGAIYHCVDVPEKYTGSDTMVKVYLNNPSSRQIPVQIKVNKLSYNQSLTMSAGGEMIVEIPVKAEEPGTLDIGIDITADGQSYHLDKTITTYYDEKNVGELKTKFEGYMTELSDLIRQCREKGISTDYEVSAHSLISHFISVLEEEAAIGEYTRTVEYDKGVTEMYTEAKANLLAYLSGEKESMAVPKYVHSDLEYDGTATYALTELDGVIEKKPVFLLGYGVFETPMRDIPFLNTTGCNFYDLTSKFSRMLASYDPNPFPGWDLIGTNNNAAANQTNFEVVTDEAASGKKSLNIRRENVTGDKYMYLYQEVVVDPNKTYECGLKAKGKTNGRIFYSLHKDQMKGRKFIYSSDEWQDYSAEYTTESGETKLYFTILVESADGDTNVNIDDIYLREKGSNKNLLRNGGAEEEAREKSKYELEAEAEGFYFRHYDLDKMCELMELAEENNVVVRKIIEISTFPTWVYDLDPEIKSSYTQFMPFALDHPLIKKLMIWNAGVILSECEKYDCVQQVGLINESQTYPNQGEHFIPHWQEYIKNIYGTIENLNAKYGSSYEKFEDVKMPTSVEATPLYYDYRQFAFGILGDHTNWLADTVREMFPQYDYGVKIMGYFRASSRGWMNNSADYPWIAERLDVNECDANALYKGGTTLIDKMGWYDYMASIKDAPVWDTEMHNLADSANMIFDDTLPYYTSADLWNSTFHNMSAGCIWLWDMDEFGTPWGTLEFCINSNYAFRPRAAWYNSKAMLDINRLAEEITAVQKEREKIGMLFSRISLIYNANSEPASLNAYSDILFNGQKAGFIDDVTAQDIHKYDLLVIPDTPNVYAEMIQEIKKYIENGGKVLIQGENSLKFNEYNEPHNAEDIAYIYSHADTTSTISQKIDEMNLCDVILIDEATGKKIDAKVEWMYGEKDGKMLVNIMNHDYDNTYQVKVVYKGRTITESLDLRKNESVGELLTLKPYQPLFIQFDK